MSITTKTESAFRALALTNTVLALLWSWPARAYESYHDPNTPGAGYCAQCHPGFVGGTGSSLHALHTGGSDPMTGSCSLCHTGTTRDNPFTMWSQNNQLGCMGCHGLDYGETIRSNYRGFAITGLHKNSGYGLRRHHARAGVAVCATCHTNDMNVAPYAENVINTGLGFTTHYYNRTDVRLRGLPINPCNNEDTLNDADSRGLDNDGDGLYDAEDPDCTGAPVTLTLQISSTNTVILSWPHGFDGWHVQSSQGTATAWADVPTVARETADGSWQVVVSPGSAPSLYRLNKRVY